MIAGAYLPFVYVCMKYKGWIWKGAVFYLLVQSMDALYDVGVFLRFFVHGPAALREVLSLDPQQSFGCIQTRLFMKHCAMIEINKARGETPKK